MATRLLAPPPRPSVTDVTATAVAQKRRAKAHACLENRIPAVLARTAQAIAQREYLKMPT